MKPTFHFLVFLSQAPVAHLRGFEVERSTQELRCLLYFAAKLLD